MNDAIPSVFQGDLPLATKLDRARTELLDLSARNRLLNVPRFSKSARTIEVIDEKSCEIFRLLVREGKAFTFVPGRESAGSGGDAAADDDALASLPQPEPDEPLDARGFAERHSDTKLQTRMTSNGLQKRLFDLYHDARTLEEEQGVNILFLALGMLKWIDPGNATSARHAPLILVPVRLERGAAGEKFKLRCRPEEQSSNLSLEAYLDRVHALRMPAFESGDEFDPEAYMGAVAAAVSDKEGWQVQRDDAVLGFFSFAKFLMYRDLDPENWPRGASLVDQPIIRSLLADGFPTRDALIPEDARIDPFIPPASMLHIVDCDSSQSLAVHDARSGRDIVIQGPPGTGKSQTIANIVASAVADGKTVLFVAEKMAALDVVKRRLDAAGVGDACLELHSNKANKRTILEELKRTWQLGSPRGDFPTGLVARLTEARDRLNAHADLMHRPHASAGLTPFQVVGHLARLAQDGIHPTDAHLVGAADWSPDDFRVRRELLAELAERVRDTGRPDDHPWRGVGLDMAIPTVVQRLVARIRELSGKLAVWAEALSALAAALEMSAPVAFSGCGLLIQTGRRVASAPGLEPEALGSPAWAERPRDIATLLEALFEHETRSAELLPVVIADGLGAQVGDLVPVLAALPEDFDDGGFASVRTLRASLPRLLTEATRLGAELGSPPDTLTQASVTRMVETAERVAVAPKASPEAFAATVWDHGVEQAGDLAAAVAAVERARRDLGDRVGGAAWTTDVSAARQVLATRTGMLRKLNGEWRRADALVRSILRSPDAPLADVLGCLDALAEGQAAIRSVQEGDAFGKAAFGPDWRGDRSASAPLLALVDWMRTLRGLGAEPRLIAGRLPERSAIGERAAAVRRLLDEATPALTELWSRSGKLAEKVLGDGASADRLDLTGVASRIALLADAEERSAAIMVDNPDLPERLRRLRGLVSLQRASSALSSGAQLGAAAFGGAWAGSRSDHALLQSAATWLESNGDLRALASRIVDRSALERACDTVETGLAAVLAELGSLCDSLAADVPRLFAVRGAEALVPADLASRLSLWIENSEHLSKWVAYRDRAERAGTLGLGSLVDRLADGRIEPSALASAFAMAYFEAVYTDMVRELPVLGRFDGRIHGALAREFADLDRERIRASATEVVRAHHRRIPPPGGIGPVGVLRGEIARKRGHMPIRQLMQKASAAVQALKPVLMMSPLSVAQFLTPGQMTFDLLVMDEASQIQPVDALGAIARCRQVVVVGDERQLPPTRFFAKMTGAQSEDDDGDGANVADIESILGLFTARGLSQRMLRWHYRSRHQSLIAVSNSQFYENRLFIVPSPYTKEAGMGLQFRAVPDGVFDSGGTATNVVEARVVAAEVIRHALTQPELSLGVATFSAAQRRAVQDELEVLRRLNPQTEAFFASHPSEPFFVKNLENVQGDERDVIMISVGFGRNAQGYMAMRFGALGSEGGERRLNVLISRAKTRCEVFASISDEDIDLERAKGRGVFALKLFLHYARTGRLTLATRTERDVESVFEEQVARALQARGYQVHPQVGIAGFFIDLAVADPERPGRYVLGIECDGTAYHDSRSARDRDRLRQAVLEDHGWIMHRIWSTDWLQRPAGQLEAVVAAIEAAKLELVERSEIGRAASRAVPVEVVTVEREDTTEIGLMEHVEEAVHATLYVEARPQARPAYDLHETPTGLLAAMVDAIVIAEGPVHLDEVVARIRGAWGLQRSGGRIQSAVERAVDVSVRRASVERNGAFLSIPGKHIVVRDRSRVTSPSLRKPEMLPPAELAAAARNVSRTGLGATKEEMVASVSRSLGFKATSTQLRQVIEGVVDGMLESGVLVRQGTLLVEGDTVTA